MVAAAVVVIAVAITAAATHGFGLGSDPTSAGRGDGGATSASGGASAAAASWGCPVTGGAGFGASEDGFNAAGIEFTADASSSAVCFFDGVSTWNLPRGHGPLVAAITDVGTFVPMMADAKPTQGRLVWGVLGNDAVTVHLTTGSTPTRPVAGSTVTPGVRVFYARVPATGAVTVTAEDSAGTVLATQTLG